MNCSSQAIAIIASASHRASRRGRVRSDSVRSASRASVHSSALESQAAGESSVRKASSGEGQ
jgi:hypothetical protein